MKLWRGQPDNWQPPEFTDKEKGQLSVALAVVFFYLAIESWTSPGRASGSGRWEWLRRIFERAFGESGEIVLFTVLGALALAYGLAHLLAKRR